MKIILIEPQPFIRPLYWNLNTEEEQLKDPKFNRVEYVYYKSYINPNKASPEIRDELYTLLNGTPEKDISAECLILLIRANMIRVIGDVYGQVYSLPPLTNFGTLYPYLSKVRLDRDIDLNPQVSWLFEVLLNRMNGYMATKINPSIIEGIGKHILEETYLISYIKSNKRIGSHDLPDIFSRLIKEDINRYRIYVYQMIVSLSEDIRITNVSDLCRDLDLLHRNKKNLSYATKEAIRTIQRM